ncbi:Abi family protein [Novosphingobium resinovorum]|jgi:abortive infection bacteriophage resistance protein|uniref:Abi family protein n=1 Tax=Novosphingobium resinovorum TaxID=158500 RepID=A0A031JMJ1_9SPHN|nr:Abi family protein [Novosphingobium resinovorum]AOR81109.1 DNA-binding protein [Novosphingobium resinovorum]EZP77809.1 Abi family protein [Novosphingobium resinovorum]
MALNPYNKPHATAAQRIAHLSSRGLVIADPNIAGHEIDLIGYERLRIYFLSRRQLALPGRPFEPAVSDRDILGLYECDIRLRDVCFAAVGQFELLLRNAMSEALSDSHGSHPYYDLSAFRDAAANLDAVQTFVALYLRSRDQRAKHYRQTYSAPALPPIWTMKEFLTFGAASRLFQCLNGTIRTKIATQFGVPSDAIFTNWLECLVDLRNICAHHDRLFNRSFQKQPARLRNAMVPTAAPQKLKAVLECLDHLLQSRGIASRVTQEVGAVLAGYPQIRPPEVGY